MPIEVALFDYGGVLVESPLVAAESYAMRRGIPVDIGVELVFGGRRFPEHPWPRMERGEMPFSLYEPAVARLAKDVAPGFKAPPLSYIYDLAPCRGVQAVAFSLRARGIAVGVATNNISEGAAFWHQDLELERFDYVFDSSLIGARKPEPRFFAHVLDVLGRDGITADSAVLIDDVGENVAGAQAAGMLGVHVNGSCGQVAEQIRTALDTLLA